MACVFRVDDSRHIGGDIGKIWAFKAAIQPPFSCPSISAWSIRALINPQENFAESMNHGGRKQAKANSQIDLAIKKVKALLGE